ncbi:MAG: ATP-binding protein, partial [Lachnospiraceae bacterium]|nr:ATP-binding protein [Lachnospiraceae bacterium]
IDISGDPGTVTVQFSDEGIPYDPLSKEDPDVKATLEEREIGGLGIFMVKKTMDSMSYEYKDGKNVLTLTKALQ